MGGNSILRGLGETVSVKERKRRTSGWLVGVAIGLAIFAAMNGCGDADDPPRSARPAPPASEWQLMNVTDQFGDVTGTAAVSEFVDPRQTGLLSPKARIVVECDDVWFSFNRPPLLRDRRLDAASGASRLGGGMGMALAEMAMWSAPHKIEVRSRPGGNHNNSLRARNRSNVQFSVVSDSEFLDAVASANRIAVGFELATGGSHVFEWSLNGSSRAIHESCKEDRAAEEQARAQQAAREEQARAQRAAREAERAAREAERAAREEQTMAERASGILAEFVGKEKFETIEGPFADGLAHYRYGELHFPGVSRGDLFAASKFGRHSLFVRYSFTCESGEQVGREIHLYECSLREHPRR